MSSITIPAQTAFNETLLFNEITLKVSSEKLPHKITISLTQQHEEKMANVWQLAINDSLLWFKNKPFTFSTSKKDISAKCFGKHILLRVADNVAAKRYIISPKTYSFCGFLPVQFGFVVNNDCVAAIDDR